MILTWKKCGSNGHWCSFEKLGLNSISATSGVYMVFYNGSPGRVVYVGSSEKKIADRLSQHRADPRFSKYKKHNLLVTWASTGIQSAKGVERYLADEWEPLIGDAYPNATPIPVNSPFN